MSDEKEGVVIIEDVQEVEVDESFNTEGLTEIEVEKAKELGLVDKDEEGSEDDDSEEEIKSATDFIDDKGNVDLEGIEEAEKNKKLNPLSDKERGLLKSVKIDRLKRQTAVNKFKEAQERLEKYEAENELGQIKDRVANTKLERIKEALTREDLTTTDIEAIINGDIEVPRVKETPEAQKLRELETQKLTQDSQAQRSASIQEVGLTLNEDFAETVKLANEWVVKNPTSLYAKTINEAFNNPQVDPVDVVEMIYEVAEKSGKKVIREVDPKIERIKKNASKRKSSASVGGSSSSRTVSYANLTPSEAARLSTEEYMKIPKEHQLRLRKAVTN